MASALMTNYAPLPVSFVSGKGAYLFDEKGESYLDALTGIAVCGLGHAHPAIQTALADQAGRLIHTSNIYQIPLQEKLAAKLVEHSGMEKVFFANSGAEVNEAAIKLARLHGHQKEIQQPCIAVMLKGFHGRTLATISATDNEKIQKGFDPLLPGFIHIPYNDIAALKQLPEINANIVAVMLEPIQGEGGIVIPDQGYLEAVRSICDEHDLLMVLDEVQSGMCRTGKWFAFQHEPVLPDVMTLAKALGNGVPIGACLARGKAASLFQPGSHGSTFGGNPLAVSAALAVIEQLEQQHLDERAAILGQRLLDGFKISLKDIKGIRQIRGKGLMLAIELENAAPDLVAKALEQKLLINVTADNVIRLLPPLILTDAEADEIISRLSQILKNYLH